MQQKMTHFPGRLGDGRFLRQKSVQKVRHFLPLERVEAMKDELDIHAMMQDIGARAKAAESGYAAATYWERRIAMPDHCR